MFFFSASTLRCVTLIKIVTLKKLKYRPLEIWNRNDSVSCIDEFYYALLGIADDESMDKMAGYEAENACH